MAPGYQYIQERTGPVKLVKIFPHSFFFLFSDYMISVNLSSGLLICSSFNVYLLVSRSSKFFLFGYCNFELQNFLWVHFLISIFYCYFLIGETLSLYLPLMV